MQPLVVAAVAHDTPPELCRHFGACGGCTQQDRTPADYAHAKAARVAAALTAVGFTIEAPPLISTPPASRRRMDLALQRQPGGAVAVGLHAARSHAVVDWHECRVLDPRLFALVPPLRALLPTLAAFRREGSAIANLLDNGPDLLLRLDAEPSAADRTRLAAFAAAHAVSRIACAVGLGEPEVACQLRPATLRFAGVAVAPPPGAFLQATRQGEAAIVSAVLAALPRRTSPRAWIAELFAGCGTLTFPLAQSGRVRAYEGSAAAVAALQHAANHAGLSGRIAATARDLRRRPLLPAEFAGCAAIVLDPPYDGAGHQMQHLAGTGLPVVYVSCNPASLARDAMVLRAAGYRLDRIAAIDQFLWSDEVESVSLFVRKEFA